ncbi:hypothetical protein ACOSQ2_006502 [Xanthoceras sorbifolium]
MFITQTFNAIFFLIITIRSQIRPTSDPPSSSSTPPPSSFSSNADDLESQPVTTTAIVAEHNHNHNQFTLQWQNIVMEFCFLSALKIALLFEQKKSQLPLSFYLLSFAILLTFLSLFVANFIGPHFKNTAQVLEKIAVMLGATIVVFTITIPLPLSLKCIAWALYAIALFTVLICRYLCL